MASALQLVSIDIQQTDFVTFAVLTAVGYDYLLTLSREIEYIWGKSWTWVSTLFILVRYCGIVSLILLMLGETVWVMAQWTFLIFLGAADAVMILRIWAMYNQSRFILGSLLASFSLEIIATILSNANSSNPKKVSTVAIQIPNFPYCVMEPTSIVWIEIAVIFEITHGAVMCILVIIQFVRQSLQVYHVSKKWQLNRYMKLLVKQGIIYFIVILLFSLLNGLGVMGNIPTEGWQMVLVFIVSYVPMFTLIPRFIMSIRELYAHDVQGRHGGAIDTGFGLSSSGRSTCETAIVFADVGQNLELGDDEEPVPMEMAEVGTTQPNPV